MPKQIRLFPSLLPFFIIAELLISIGVVKFIGVILEPLMRPLLRSLALNLAPAGNPEAIPIAQTNPP
ncbi:nucleoside recognition domain-containing protein, partial [Bacillus sp. B-TM1]